MGVRLGALEFDSILKSLYCYTKSKEGPRNVMRDCLTTAGHELFAHGPKFYEEHIRNLRTIARSSGIDCSSLDPTFDERTENWRQKYGTECKM